MRGFLCLHYASMIHFENLASTRLTILPALLKVILVLSTCLLSTLVLSEDQITSLEADGPDQGISAYELIKSFGGRKSIESPDLYPDNHPNMPHIYEETDAEVGHHFVFSLHRDIDKDRDKYVKFADRQRNEIKVYSGSKQSLKGYENETLTYRWKFKLENNMSLSKNFSHFFQLKSVDDGIGMPILTISGINYKHNRWLGLSHAAVKKSSILVKKSWNEVSGVWLEAECTVTYANSGNLRVTIKQLSTNKTIIDYESDNIDMWRGTKKSHFVRPKWGFYRSLKSKTMLEFAEDTIRFADFEVVKSKMN